MEKALRVHKGKERLVSADEMRLEYHGRVPGDISFVCPLCRQPLFPVLSGSRQSPHFRHERNNARAHECELYTRSLGYFSTYQSVPMPMFIRKSRDRNERFIIEGGFRKLDQKDLFRLEHDGAKVQIAQRSYRVTSGRFGAGLTKLPFDEVSLNIGSIVRLVGTSLDLGSTWGYPEDARRAMVFARDPDTCQGKRLKIGDTIPFETDLFLLAPEKEHCRICSAFSGAQKAGVAGSRSTASGLMVYEVTLTKEDEHWRQGKDYLSECGFEVDEREDAPRLIWPPSLTSSGDLLPLFENAKCIFTAETKYSKSGSIYFHTGDDVSGRVRTVPLLASDNADRGFAIAKNNAKLSFVTTRDWVFSSAVLLHSSDLVIGEWLHELDLDPSLSLESGCWTLRMPYSAEVKCYRRDGRIQVVEINQDNKEFAFVENSLDRIQILRNLGASFGQVVIFERCFDVVAAPKEEMAKASARREIVGLGMPKDVEFAVKRRSGKLTSDQGVDKHRAQTRKAMGQ